MHGMRETRQQLRDDGLLRELDPGASLSFRLELGALPDAAAVAAYESAAGSTGTRRVFP
jgi:hypothetical protein